MVIAARIEAIRLHWRIFPIDDLPVEIMSKIFMMVGWGPHDPDLGMMLRMRLTWVNRRWREIAINTQHLWNTIWFRDHFPYNRSLLFLERAGTSPLDIRLNEHLRYFESGRKPEEELSADRVNWVMDRILAKSDQIRRLIVLVENWPGIFAVHRKLATPPRPMKQLQHLEIHRTGRFDSEAAPNMDPNPFEQFVVLCGGYTPALSHITLNGTHIDWLNSPPSNLTILDLRRSSPRCMPPIDAFLNVLRTCPRLHRLLLDGAAPPVPNQDVIRELKAVTLNELCILCIGDYSLQYCCFLFSFINSPNIRDLSLQNLNAEDFGLFLRTITGKYPKVRVLTLSTFEVDMIKQNERVLARWYNSMPEITYVRFRQVSPMFIHVLSTDYRFHEGDSVPLEMTFDQYQEILRGPGEYKVLLPKLETLEFSFMNVKEVAHYVNIRSNLQAPLKRILVEQRWCNTLPEAESSHLKTLKNVYLTRNLPIASHGDLGQRNLAIAPENIRAGSRLRLPQPQS